VDCEVLFVIELGEDTPQGPGREAYTASVKQSHLAPAGAAVLPDEALEHSDVTQGPFAGSASNGMRC